MASTSGGDGNECTASLIELDQLPERVTFSCDEPTSSVPGLMTEEVPYMSWARVCLVALACREVCISFAPMSFSLGR